MVDYFFTMSKRFYAIPLAIVAVGLVGLKDLKAAEPVTLEFWELSVGEELMRSLLDKFERQHPGIRVRFQQLSWDFGLDKIITAIAAGNAPDLVELGTDWVAQFAASGVLWDITDRVRSLKDEYFLWEPVTYQGRVYGLPWLAGTRVLFYNRDLFAQAGLDPNRPPETWSELLEAAKAVHALGDNIYGIGIHVGEAYAPWQQFLPFVWGNGGDVLDSNWRRCLLNQPQAIEALQFYRSLKPYALVERQPQVNQTFAEGRLGIQMSGSWNFALIPRVNPRLDYGVAILPKPDRDRGRPASFAGGEVLVILKNAKHKEAALKLAQFLIQKEQAMAVVEAQRNIVPAAKGAVDHPYYERHPEQRVLLEQMKTAVAPPNHPAWARIQEEITRAIEEVILGGRDPDQTLEKTTAKVDRLLLAQETHGRFSDTLIFIGFLMALSITLVAVGIRRRRKKGKAGIRHTPYNLWTSSVFVSPWVVTLLAFSLIPLVHSFVLSFSRYNLLTSEFAFVGLKNFWEVCREPEFLRALWHTILFAAGSIPPTMILALFAAVLINTRVPFKQLYQAGLFLPAVTSVIVIATIFTYLYAQDGLINTVLRWLHLPVPDPPWLLNRDWALLSIMFMNVWASFGYYTVLFLAGLQTIPMELYEAASIDGANEWQKFRYITLPQLKPIVLLAVVINTIRALQVFPEIFAMTQGGPLGATTTVVWYLYETGFHRFDMGMASAVGYILFFIIMGLSWIQIRAFREEEV